MCIETTATPASTTLEAKKEPLAASPVHDILTKEHLDDLVEQIKDACSKPVMNIANPTTVAGIVYGMVPGIPKTVYDLRMKEEKLKHEIFAIIAKLWGTYSKNGVEMILIMKGLLRSSQGAADITRRKKDMLALAALEGKDRILAILNNYKWMDEFFRFYPGHQQQDSFRFVSREAPPAPPVKVHVIGMGIGGGFAASGLAKAGCDVTAFEKRSETDVGSRYQTASWTMYESAQELLDEEGYQELNRYRQTINFTHQDGEKSVFESNRCTIVLGGAVDTGVKSAKRCGAKVHFNMPNYLEWRELADEEEPDIVAVFTGAHTAKIYGIEEELGFMCWPESISTGHLWVKMGKSDKRCDYTNRIVSTKRDEMWCYTISSARDDIHDIDRTVQNLEKTIRREQSKVETDEEKKAVEGKYEKQMARLLEVRGMMTEGETERYTYEFTSAPVNKSNDDKLEKAREDGSLVINSKYDVVPTFASQTTFGEGPMTTKFGAKVVVCGGDAGVSPNPLAARGATVACEHGVSLVQMALALGHVKVMLEDLHHHKVDESWIADVEKLQSLLPKYYDALTISENFVQWTQTLICNYYSEDYGTK